MVKFVISRTLVNPKTRTRFNFKKNYMLWFVCLLSRALEWKSNKHIILKNFFSFLHRLCDGFCVKFCENKSKIIIDIVCFTVFVQYLHY